MALNLVLSRFHRNVRSGLGSLGSQSVTLRGTSRLLPCTASCVDYAAMRQSSSSCRLILAFDCFERGAFTRLPGIGWQMLGLG